MTTGTGAVALAERAAVASDASATLFSELRAALSAALGIDLLDLRSRGADGTWVLICRFAEHGESAPADAPTPRPSAVEPIDPWMIPEPPEPPFVSPVVTSRPFDGDGSDDLLRFIEEADRSAEVPALGVGGELPPPLTAEERSRMLASTIAGDVVLALMHDGVAADPERLGAALDEGWQRYTVEVRRLGREPDAALYRRASDLAAAMIVEGI